MAAALQKRRVQGPKKAHPTEKIDESARRKRLEPANYFAQSDGNNAWARDHIYGIEKDYRLARVAKISLLIACRNEMCNEKKWLLIQKTQ